jgi:hypothetical protein
MTLNIANYCVTDVYIYIFLEHFITLNKKRNIHSRKRFVRIGRWGTHLDETATLRGGLRKFCIMCLMIALLASIIRLLKINDTVMCGVYTSTLHGGNQNSMQSCCRRTLLKIPIKYLSAVGKLILNCFKKEKNFWMNLSASDWGLMSGTCVKCD